MADVSMEKVLTLVYKCSWRMTVFRDCEVAPVFNWQELVRLLFVDENDTVLLEFQLVEKKCTLSRCCSSVNTIFRKNFYFGKNSQLMILWGKCYL